MTTDDRRPDDARQPGSAAGDARLEAHVRSALEGEASRISPADRLADILAEAHSTDRSPERLTFSPASSTMARCKAPPSPVGIR